MGKTLLILIASSFLGVTKADPLIQAIMTNCNVGVVERLAESSLGVNATNNVGATTLMVAAQYNSHPEVILRLAELGADTSAKDEAVWLAAKGNNSDVMKALISLGADIHSRDSLGGTLLMEAAMRNSHTDVLDVIVQSGVEVDAVDDFGHTALIKAVKYNAETDALERLVALGADVNHKTEAKMTALNYVSGYRNINIAKRLLLLGADVNAVSKKGYSPLIYAGKFKSDTPYFNLLLEFDADVNIRANDGRTALMKAAEFNNANSIYELLNRGADPTPVDDSGMSALDYALRYAKRVEADEETEVCMMLNIALRAKIDGVQAVIPEPQLTIKFSKCFLRYDTMNGETEIILYNIRQSRLITLTEENFRKAFDLTEFKIDELALSDPRSEKKTIRVKARTKNFMMNTPVQQLFSNLLNTQAKVELQHSFPQMKMNVLLPMQKNMYVGDNNALRVLQSEDQRQILIEFDISKNPLEVTIGWKKREPATKKTDPTFQNSVRQFQRDADIIRLEHILYWSGLIEEYHEQKGSFPLQDQLEENEFAVLVKIATQIQRQFISPGSKDYNSELDLNVNGKFQELSVSTFISELEDGLGREIKERYDIQKAPTVNPIGYYYFATPDGYLIWCICPTFGVSKISTLLMDGFTPTVNIVSKGMKGKVTKALTRQELIENPIFKEWQKRKLTADKESYIRQLIIENETDSKKLNRSQNQEPVLELQQSNSTSSATANSKPSNKTKPSTPPWNEVRSWVYQLTNYKEGKLDEIAASNFDLAVIDLSRDGSNDFFTRHEIEQLKASGKLVLAYFEIGAIEEYRPEWNRVPNELKAGKVEGWPKEQYVKFWDERWWPIVKGRVDQALGAGFDGAYLDMLTTYDEIPKSGLDPEQRAHKMVDLIVRLSQYAKTQNPRFKIVPQNCPELYTWSFWEPKPNREYIEAIDGIGLESVFFLAHDKPAKQSWCKENRTNAIAIKQAGKLVLGVDYAKKPSSIAQAYKKQRAIGFVPYVTVEDLDIVSPEVAAK